MKKGGWEKCVGRSGREIAERTVGMVGVDLRSRSRLDSRYLCTVVTVSTAGSGTADLLVRSAWGSAE